ncbi:MAG: PQQ-binding-like beta-propeller repeat protein, partial [Candidatus Limnocylindrales bacterium]
MRRLVSFAVVALLTLTACTRTGDWPQFRNGPTSQGHNTQETILSPSNVAALGVVWTGPMGWAHFSSPAVADGVVYVGSTDHKLYAYAVGCSSGGGTCTPLWTATTGNQISSSPAVADGVVYVGSEDDKLYAFAVGCSTGGGTCTPLWTATTGDQISHSSPAVADGVVYVGSGNGKLYAFAVGCSSGGGSCTPLWTATTGG